MRAGYNKELAIKASTTVMGLDKIKELQKDSNGNVVRDYRSELDAYVKSEELFVLPDIELKYFDGHSHYSNFVKNQSPNFKGVVKEVMLAELSKTKKEFSVLEFFVMGVNYIYSKFTKPSKEELITKKGYYWIYNQMKTADSCKRRLAS